MENKGLFTTLVCLSMPFVMLQSIEVIKHIEIKNLHQLLQMESK